MTTIQPDQTTVQTLVAEHGPAVYRLCRRLSHHPEDAYQRAWEKALKNLHRFRTPGPPFRAWMLTLTRRLLIDEHRRQKVRPQAPLTDTLRCPEPNAEERVSHKTDNLHLQRAVDALPSDQRLVVVLFHLEEVPIAVISAELNLPIGTIKSRLHRGRAALAATLRGSE